MIRRFAFYMLLWPLLINSPILADEWQKVENEYYSIILPAFWVKKYQNLPIDRKAIIKGTTVWINYNSWCDKKPTVTNVETITSLTIESYEVLDKEKLTMGEMRSLLLKSQIFGDWVIKSIDTFRGNDFERYVVLKKDQSMSIVEGSKEFESLCYHLLYSRNDRIYILTLSTPNENALEQGILDKIMNSFKLK